MGGTLGTAVFLSVLFSTVGARIASSVGDVSGTAAYRAALAAHPDQAQLLRSGGSNVLSDTGFIGRLDPVLAAPFRNGFSSSMDLIFLIAAGVIAVGFVLLLLFLPEETLRGGAPVAAQAEAAEGAGAPDVPAPTAVSPGVGVMAPPDDRPAQQPAHR
jgi:hypothetical protein